MNITVNQSLQIIRFRFFAPFWRQLEAFWFWWIAELMALLPGNVQAALLQRDERIFVEIDREELVIRRGRIADNKELARFPASLPKQLSVDVPAGARKVVLLLPADTVLVRSMTLPVAAEENLREVLSFEMDRQTPFSVDQIYYDCIVTDRNANRKTLSVDLVLTPRETADRLLEGLSRVGIEIDIMSARNGSGNDVLPVNLLPERQRSNGSKAVFRVNAILTAAVACLLITAIGLPLVQKRQILRELEPQLAEAVAQARQANELRSQVERLVSGSEYLVRKKQKRTAILETLNEVTHILPDDTSLRQVDISGSEIRLLGQSYSSATLISLLESSPRLENVQFTSPVIRIPSTGEERFHLSATIGEGESR